MLSLQGLSRLPKVFSEDTVNRFLENNENLCWLPSMSPVNELQHEVMRLNLHSSDSLWSNLAVKSTHLEGENSCAQSCKLHISRNVK